MKTETKVGIFVIAALAGLGWLSYQSGELTTGSQSQNMRILESDFSSADGLTVGAKVKVSGVEIGEVSEIYLSDEGLAAVKMNIRKDVNLPANVLAQIASSGIIGEKFVALTTDFGAEGQLATDATNIPSKPAASIDDIASNFSDMSADLKEVTAALRSSLGGKENAAKLSRIVDNLDNMGQRLNNILSDDGDAGELIANFNIAAKNLATITTRLERGEGTLGKMLSEDGENPFGNLDAAMKDIREVAAKLNNGEGTLGRLINDPATVDKIENALDSITATTGRIEAFRTEVDFMAYQMAAEDVGKGQFNITFRPRPSRYYVLGITADGMATEADDARSTSSFKGEDFGEELKFTAQFGHVWENAILGQDLGLRVGLKDSTGGIGVDTKFNIYNRDLRLSADLYDWSGENSGSGEEQPHLDITAKYDLIDRVLYAVGGYDNVLDSKYGSPFIGLGVRFEDDDLKYMIGQAL